VPDSSPPIERKAGFFMTTITLTEYHYTDADYLRIPDFCFVLSVFKVCDDDAPHYLVFTDDKLKLAEAA
jgi:hypothetical protein